LTGNVVKSKSNRLEREWKITPIQRELLWMLHTTMN
jgi:hypothetical protein